MSEVPERPDMLPAIFKVGAIPREGGTGSGRLLISPGDIVLELRGFFPLLRSTDRVHHTDDRNVTLLLGWFLPPWMNTSLVLGDLGSPLAIAVTWGGARRRLRRSLRAAGFEVKEIATLFSMGLRFMRTY